MFASDRFLARPFSLLLILTFTLFSITGCKTEGEKRYEEAKELRKRQLADQALTAFADAATLLEQEGENPAKAFYKMASIHKGRGELDQAVEFYNKAIEKDPDDLKYKERLAGVYIFQEKLEEATEIIEEAKEHPSIKYDIKMLKNLEIREAQIAAKREEIAEREAAALVGDDDSTTGGLTASVKVGDIEASVALTQDGGIEIDADTDDDEPTSQPAGE
jgi:tetratricopeptide (TPR) repeat protein